MDRGQWTEYDLILRAEGVAQLLAMLDEREREWDFESHECKGDLRIIAQLEDARYHLTQTINALKAIDRMVGQEENINGHINERDT